MRIGGGTTGSLLILLFWSLAANAQDKEDVASLDKVELEKKIRTTDLGLRVDCTHDFNLPKGSTQNCLNVSGLRYSFSEQVFPNLRGIIAFDPFATPIHGKRSHPIRQNLPSVQDSALFLVDDYRLIWTPRPNLVVAVEELHGMTAPPSYSGLAFGLLAAESGWDQTALSVTYRLTALSGMQVKFAAGNGEGENGQNLDPQQFVGFSVDAKVIPGVGTKLGLSFDGNNTGSSAYEFERQNFTRCGITQATTANQGYSTQRLGAAAYLDGSLPAARGLKAVLGWQRNVLSDLDKEKFSAPTLVDLRDQDKPTLAAVGNLEDCPTLDVDSVFVEDPNGAEVNTVQKTIMAINLSYRVLDTYFVGFDYTSRRVDSGSVKLFQVCQGYTGTTCQKKLKGARSNQLTQTAYTFGGGVDLSDGLKLSLEYYKSSFDKNYTQFFYEGRNGTASNVLELFNARIAYHWF